MAAAAAIVGLVGGGVNALGQVKQGQAAKQAADYNAKINLQNADAAEQEGLVQVGRQQRGAAQNIGSTRAKYSASGIDTGSGSALDVIQASAEQAAMDSAMIKYNADTKAYGLRQSANLNVFEGSNALASAQMGAAGTLLGSAGSAAGSMYGGKK